MHKIKVLVFGNENFNTSLEELKEHLNFKLTTTFENLNSNLFESYDILFFYQDYLQDISYENNQQKMRIFTKNITDIVVGSSIACAGVCLTATEICKDSNGFVFEVYVSPETLLKTTLKNYRNGSRINLERSLHMGDEIAGHIVQGHVDDTVKIVDIIITYWILS